MFDHLKLSVRFLLLFVAKSWRWGVAENLLSFHRHCSWWTFVNDERVLLLDAHNTVLICRQTTVQFWKPLKFWAILLRALVMLWGRDGNKTIDCIFCICNELGRYYLSIQSCAEGLFCERTFLNGLGLWYCYRCLHRLMMGNDTRSHL